MFLLFKIQVAVSQNEVLLLQWAWNKKKWLGKDLPVRMEPFAFIKKILMGERFLKTATLYAIWINIKKNLRFCGSDRFVLFFY